MGMDRMGIMFRIMGGLSEAWDENSQLRFGQLITNILYKKIGPHQGLFYISDEDVEDEIYKFLKKVRDEDEEQLP